MKSRLILLILVSLAAPVGAQAPIRVPAVDPKVDHWAYKKPVRPVVPAVERRAWVRNPIDAFVAAQHEKRGLEPRPRAPKRVLLRRVYLDLIGLPPTRAEMNGFLADDSAGAFEAVVDKLLADPRYGERWGRHWMDIWRYSDWSGWQKQVRQSQKHIWRWRDWIIESLNADKGYDQMVREMLAGDEIAPEDPDTLRATGFLVRNWYKFNRNTWLEGTIEHTAKAFLGTTVNCARCHDHFHDPITQKEYYRFRAIFEPHQVRTDRRPGEKDVSKDGVVRAYDKETNAKTYLFFRGQDTRPDKKNPLQPGVPRALAGDPFAIEPVALPRSAAAPHRREFVVQEDLAVANQAVVAARKGVDAALARVAKAEHAAAGEAKSAADRDKLRAAVLTTRGQLPLAMMQVPIAEAKRDELEVLLRLESLEDGGKKDSDAWKQAARKAQSIQRRRRVLDAEKLQFAERRAVAIARAESERATRAAAKKADKALAAARKKAMANLTKANRKLAAADKKVNEAKAAAKQPASTTFTPRKVPVYPATSTGRRLALARWITSEQNPLAARVAVNHIWMRHFGKPLVESVFNFGLSGKRPTHPALLDWLAVDFMNHGFHMKRLHRLIVLSSAWQSDSSGHRENEAIDASNRYLWRMNTRRMEAEVIRDSVLYVTGQLDAMMGGPDIDHRKGLAVARRSVYLQHASEKQMELLTLFDVAGVGECYERTESIVPQQALAMANSSLVTEKSRILARRLCQEIGEDYHAKEQSGFVALAFEQVLGRPPTDRERSECVAFLAAQTTRLSNQKKLTAFATKGKGKGKVQGKVHVEPAADPRKRARESLVHVLFNHHGFVTIR